MSVHQQSEDEIRDLTDRVFLLQRRLAEGKLHFAEHLADDFYRSFKAIQLSPSGLVNPATVDGRIRSAILALKHFAYREEAKSACSLADIQENYFSFLSSQFGWMLDEVLKNRCTPEQFARAVSSKSDFVQHIVDGMPEMVNDLKDFWSFASEAGVFHLQDSAHLKASFSGDLFPAYSENPVSSAGLYLDTIVLPCPILRIAPLLGVLPDREIAALLIKHAVNALTYRSLATANLSPPIAIILPHSDDITRGENSDLLIRATPEILTHAGYIFDRRFDDLVHYREFCSSLNSIESVLAELKRPERVLFDTTWQRGAEAQLRRAITEVQPTLPGFDPTNPGDQIYSATVGRMPQALATAMISQQFGSTPLISARTSWEYFRWFTEYQADKDSQRAQDSKAEHITHALISQHDYNLSWLGNVPIDTVLEIRKNGQAEELRQILSFGIDELISAKPENFHRTSDQVVDNLNRAFDGHQKDILEAKKNKLKLYGFDVGSLVVTGTIAVTAATTASPLLGAASGLLGILGLPNLRDIRSRFKEQKAIDTERKNSVTGLLFSHVKNPD
ncbi:hypothetical protein [Stenotrophomonas sp. 59]|uniref:hypothetical protein n=1 Tax=Stenotrophomonas sp. 59 TaxID=3051120 RepID=UPI00256F27BB|nr:hypothetical protein [Stenotrophomonas sp. 59]